jgi:TPR repeat protein
LIQQQRGGPSEYLTRRVTLRQNQRMRWRGLRPWVALIGPLFAVMVLTVGPVALKSAKLSWPGWVVPALAAGGGTLLLVAAPVMQSRVEALTQRNKNETDLESRRETAIISLVGSGRDLPLVRDVVDRALLGIHPAIPLPAGADPRLSNDLPEYVPRDLDADLRAALRATSTNGGFLIVVGRAASGKTRTCYEAIKSTLGDWRLCMPSNAEQITALASSGADLSHTVIWLNEAQKFLGNGMLTVETVRRLLSDSQRPVVLIGTIWPDIYEALRSPPEEGSDFNRDASEILALARRFAMADKMNDAEQARALELSEADPRIEEALSHEGGSSVTEVLASAPELIHRWNQADSPYGAALVGAAVHARLLNHPEPVPLKVLEPLATDLLSGADKATAPPDWLSEAVIWACKPVRGIAAPLTPYASEVGVVDGFCVSDILVQHGSRIHPDVHQTTSQKQWTIIIDNASPGACTRLGGFALLQENYKRSHEAFIKAVDSGSVHAMLFAGASAIIEDTSSELGMSLLRRASDAGNATASVILGRLLLISGNLEEGQDRILRGAVDGEYADALGFLGSHLMKHAKSEEALPILRRAASQGDADAMFFLAGALLRDDAKQEEALELLRQAADIGHLRAMCTLGSKLLSEGEEEEGLSLLRDAAEQGHQRSVAVLGTHLVNSGDVESGMDALRTAARGGNHHAMVTLGRLAMQEGSYGDARLYWEQASAAGSASGKASLGALLLGLDGDTPEARAHLRDASKKGHVEASTNLGALLVESGDREEVDEGVRLLNQAAAKGNGNAMNVLGVVALNSGDTTAAKEWWQRAAAKDSKGAMTNLAELLRSQGDEAGGRAWSTRAETLDTDHVSFDIAELRDGNSPNDSEE